MRWIVFVAAVILALLVLRDCRDSDTPEGQRADSTLAEEPAWRDTVKAQDDTIAAMNVIIQQQADSLAIAKKKAVEAEQKGQDAVADAKRADSNAEVSLDSMRAARDQWRRAALHYSQVVVPAYQAQIAAAVRLQASTQAAADTLKAQRDASRNREARVAKDLADLREATKPHGFRALGLELPSWTDEVLLVTASAVTTYAVTQRR